MKATFLSSLAACAAIALTSASAETLGGLSNFQKVDANVYRGAQPTPDGFRNLASLGVKTVVDLRRQNEHDVDQERRIVEGLGMRYVNIPMEGVVSPTDAQVSQVLDLLNNSSSGPVFVHCKRGADRTGGVIACYRVQHDHWDNKTALKEAKSMGMRWTQVGIKAYVISYTPGKASPAAATAAIIAPTAVH